MEPSRPDGRGSVVERQSRVCDLQEPADDHSFPGGASAAQQVTVVSECSLGSGTDIKDGGTAVILLAAFSQLQRDHVSCGTLRNLFCTP